MVYTQLRMHPIKWDAQTSLGFWETNESSNLSQITRPSDSQQNKRTCRIVDFAVLADHRVKLKESEKRDKYLDLARKLKKYGTKSDGDTNRNWRVRYSHQRIDIGTRGFGNKRTSGDHLNYSIVEINQNSRKRLEETCFSSSEKPSSNTLVKKSQVSKIIIQKEENLQNCRLCCPGWPQNKTERMWKEG